MGGERFDLQTDELSISKLVDLISLDGTFSNNDNAEFQEANNKMKEVVVATNITSVFLTSIGEVMNIVSDKSVQDYLESSLVHNGKLGFIDSNGHFVLVHHII